MDVFIKKPGMLLGVGVCVCVCECECVDSGQKNAFLQMECYQVLLKFLL